MVMRPVSLPRTLKGVGGIRLINMPGVKYPESVLQGRKGTDHKSGKPHTKAPDWGISTRDAAKMLGISTRSARVMLNRHKADFHLVSQQGRCACLYWDRRVVERMLAKRMPLVTSIPEKLCTAKEACYILLVARSSLTRYVKQKLLHEYRVRHATRTGVRLQSYFLRAEVRKLAAKRNAARLRAEQAQKARLQRNYAEEKGGAPPGD